MPDQIPSDQDECKEAETKLRIWHERNSIAIEQSNRGLSKPLNLKSILARVEARVAACPQGS
jgi:hypothetical protein